MRFVVGAPDIRAAIATLPCCRGTEGLLPFPLLTLEKTSFESRSDALLMWCHQGCCGGAGLTTPPFLVAAPALRFLKRSRRPARTSLGYFTLQTHIPHYLRLHPAMPSAELWIPP